MKTPRSLFQNILPAVFAAVFLSNSILNVPPYVHRRKDQRQQDTKAAEKGKYGNTLLLGLKDDRDAHAEKIISYFFPVIQPVVKPLTWLVLCGVQKRMAYKPLKAYVFARCH